MQTTKNRGGIAEISVLRASYASDLVMFNDVTAYKPKPDDGFAWEDIEITEIKEFKHPAATGIGGRIVSFSAVLIHAGYSEAKEETLNNLRDRPVFVYYRTLNDQKHIVERALLTFTRVQEFSTGAVTGFEITLKVELPHDVFFCTGTAAVIIPEVIVPPVVVPTETVLWAEYFTKFNADGKAPYNWYLNVYNNITVTTNGNNLHVSATMSSDIDIVNYLISIKTGNTGSKFSNKKLRFELDIKEINLPKERPPYAPATDAAYSAFSFEIREVRSDAELKWYVSEHLFTLNPGVLSYEVTIDNPLGLEVELGLGGSYVIGELLLDITSIKIIEVP